MVVPFSMPVLVLAIAIAAPSETTPRVTSDSPEYCSSLAARVAVMPAGKREPSKSLAAEGVKLCGAGHSRAGIAKLRRAVKAAQIEP
jgi:hypothetical protein